MLGKLTLKIKVTFNVFFLYFDITNMQKTYVFNPRPKRKARIRTSDKAPWNELTKSLQKL